MNMLIVTSAGVQYRALGGNILPFHPRGSDTVPAMLTPGERVLSIDQNRALMAGASGSLVLPITLAIDGQRLAEILLPLSAAELRRLRLA